MHQHVSCAHNLLSLPSSPFPLFLSLSAWLDETITTDLYQLVTHEQLSLTVNRLTAYPYVYSVGLNYDRDSRIYVRLTAAN